MTRSKSLSEWYTEEESTGKRGDVEPPTGETLRTIQHSISTPGHGLSSRPTIEDTAEDSNPFRVGTPPRYDDNDPPTSPLPHSPSAASEEDSEEEDSELEEEEEGEALFMSEVSDSALQHLPEDVKTVVLPNQRQRQRAACRRLGASR